jgi:hypothetical protein
MSGSLFSSGRFGGWCFRHRCFDRRGFRDRSGFDSWRLGFSRRSLLISARTAIAIVGPLASWAVLSSILSHFGNDEWQESHLAGFADRAGDHPLLLGRIAGLPAGQNLAAIVEEASENIDLLIVDGVDLIDGQIADFPASLALKALTAFAHYGVFVHTGSATGSTLSSIVTLTLRSCSFFTHNAKGEYTTCLAGAGVGVGVGGGHARLNPLLARKHCLREAWAWIELSLQSPGVLLR